MQPHRGAAIPEARLVAPREREGFPTAQFLGDDDLEVRQQPVIEIDLDVAVVIEPAHAPTVTPRRDG